MRIVLTLSIVLLLLLGCAAPPAPEPEPEPQAHPIVGAWTVSSSASTDPEGVETTNDSPQPSLFIFTESHYSVTFVPGTEPREQFADGVWPMGDALPTDEEQLAAYGQFVSNAGTYSISGSTITMDPIVAKHPNFMAQGTNVGEISIDGDTMTLNGEQGDNTTAVTLRRVE